LKSYEEKNALILDYAFELLSAFGSKLTLFASAFRVSGPRLESASAIED